MAKKLNALEIIREAFLALQTSHPKLVARLSAAITASGGGESEVARVEAAFREGAVALVPTEKDAAETLFTLAEVLAQIPRYKLK